MDILILKIRSPHLGRIECRVEPRGEGRGRQSLARAKKQNAARNHSRFQEMETMFCGLIIRFPERAGKRLEMLCREHTPPLDLPHPPLQEHKAGKSEPRVAAAHCPRVEESEPASGVPESTVELS